MLALVHNGRTRNLGAALVQIGSGGNASDYIFDPATGLSKDPRLAFDLQDLTLTQLQTALTNPSGVTADLAALNGQLLNGSGLPCGTVASGDPNCTGGIPAASSLSFAGAFASVPAWAWLLGGGAVLFGLVKK